MGAPALNQRTPSQVEQATCMLVFGLCMPQLSVPTISTLLSQIPSLIFGFNTCRQKRQQDPPSHLLLSRTNLPMTLTAPVLPRQAHHSCATWRPHCTQRMAPSWPTCTARARAAPGHGLPVTVTALRTRTRASGRLCLQ